MDRIIYFKDMKGYEKLTEHQKKYAGNGIAFDTGQTGIYAGFMGRKQESLGWKLA